jgi:hypothetical protein
VPHGIDHVVTIHKHMDLILKLRGAVIMVRKNEIFHGSVIPLYLSLSHRMIRSATGMADPSSYLSTLKIKILSMKIRLFDSNLILLLIILIWYNLLVEHSYHFFLLLTKILLF